MTRRRGCSTASTRKAKAVVCGPQATEADARESCENAGKRPTSFVEVSRGSIVVQAEGADGDKAAKALAADAYFVLEDDPSLVGRDIKDPEQDVDPTTGQPNITYDVTDAGREKWQTMTREIARRGQAAVLPGVDPSLAANHFALVLDNKLISVPYIDPQQNPDGIDGENGSQISGNFTTKSAKELAAMLRTGPLPLALELTHQRRVAAKVTPAPAG